MQFLFYREYKVCYFVYLNILNFDVLLIYSQVKIEREREYNEDFRFYGDFIFWGNLVVSYKGCILKFVLFVRGGGYLRSN